MNETSTVTRATKAPKRPRVPKDSAVPSRPLPAPMGLSPLDAAALAALLHSLAPGAALVVMVDSEEGGLMAQMTKAGGGTVMAAVARLGGALAVMDFQHGLGGASGRYEVIEDAAAALGLALAEGRSLGRH